MSSTIVVVVFLHDIIVQVEDEIELGDSCVEVAKIVCRKCHMLITELLRVRQVLPLLGAQLGYALVQLVEGVVLLSQCLLIQMDLAPERLRQVGRLEDMGRLEERMVRLTRLVLHDLLNQVPVDLAQATVEHLASLEHVEDAIREHLLAVHGAIDGEKELTVAEVRVYWHVDAVSNVECQQEGLLLQLWFELKIGEDLVLALCLVLDWEGQLH